MGELSLQPVTNNLSFFLNILGLDNTLTPKFTLCSCVTVNKLSPEKHTPH